MDQYFSPSLPLPSFPSSIPSSSGFIPNINKTTNIFPYQHIRSIKNITGFIVNMHDPTNFDIDLNLSPLQKHKYQDVIFTTYKYFDFDHPLITLSSIDQIDNPLSGIAYRCRLRGIAINKSVNHGHNSQIYSLVKNLIDQSDGWVTCTISDIDIYRRILVDITFHINDQIIDLKDYILEYSQSQSFPPYYPYIPTKYH